MECARPINGDCAARSHAGQRSARLGRVSAPRVRGLDSGCVWGKELTAWIAEEDRFVAVPAARVYSPTSLPD